MIGDKHDRFAGKRLHADKEYKGLGLGTETSMCMDCGEVFSNTRNFDRHRFGEEKAKKAGVKVGCQNPSTVGLEFRGGVWKMPFNPNASFLHNKSEEQE